MKRHLSLALIALAVVVAVSPVFAATAAKAPTAAKPAAAAAAKPAPATPAKPAHGKMEAPTADAGKVDLNSATKDELMKVPGIAEATATKIVAGRPFKAKNELVSKGIVNKAQYVKLQKYVVARQK